VKPIDRPPAAWYLEKEGTQLGAVDPLEANSLLDARCVKKRFSGIWLRDTPRAADLNHQLLRAMSAKPEPPPDSTNAQ